MRILYLLIFVSVFSASCQRKQVDQEVLKLRLSNEPRFFNPLTRQDSVSQKIFDLIFDSLLSFREASQSPQGSMAESWKVSPDGLTYEFKLRPNNFWHDGKPVSAEDVKFSLEAWKKSSLPIGDSLRELDRVEVIASDFVRVRLKSPYYRHLYIIGAAYILPKHIYGSEKDSPDLIGSGPYQFVRWTPSSHILLERSPRQAMKSDSFSKISFRFILDDQTAWLAFQKKDLDAIDFRPSYLEKWKSFKTKFFLIQREDFSSFTYMGFNFKRPLFADRNFREALRDLFPFEEINSKLFLSSKQRAWSFFFNLQDFKETKTSSLSEEILEKWKGQKIEVLIPAGSLEAERMLLAYQVELRNLGILMELKILEWASFLDAIDSKNFDAYIASWNRDLQTDPYILFHSKGSVNFGSYVSPEMESLLGQHQKALHLQDRLKLQMQITKLIQKDLPILLLYENPAGLFYHPERLDLQNSPYPENWKLKDFQQKQHLQ